MSDVELGLRRRPGPKMTDVVLGRIMLNEFCERVIGQDFRLGACSTQRPTWMKLRITAMLMAGPLGSGAR